MLTVFSVVGLEPLTMISFLMTGSLNSGSMLRDQSGTADTSPVLIAVSASEIASVIWWCCSCNRVILALACK